MQSKCTQLPFNRWYKWKDLVLFNHLNDVSQPDIQNGDHFSRWPPLILVKNSPVNLACAGTDLDQI